MAKASWDYKSQTWIPLPRCIPKTEQSLYSIPYQTSASEIANRTLARSTKKSRVGRAGTGIRMVENSSSRPICEKGTHVLRLSKTLTIPSSLVRGFPRRVGGFGERGAAVIAGASPRGAGGAGQAGPAGGRERGRGYGCKPQHRGGWDAGLDGGGFHVASYARGCRIRAPTRGHPQIRGRSDETNAPGLGSHRVERRAGK